LLLNREFFIFKLFFFLFVADDLKKFLFLCMSLLINFCVSRFSGSPGGSEKEEMLQPRQGYEKAKFELLQLSLFPFLC
jgi:hypothetical protein